ncbi:coumaroyl-CoA:anthocyanidin 3-O-glucoside-6''-O-coumaroyltransferase 2-like [Oryza brachyantha]|uniref:coumaroyl-CoA:anthocyanidin 3-O-glucoside-6''-O-coumaroyltransferase 2-like n=1 Tax=Oryza brachyantha TaxID=4533 RepID=UPI001AD9B93D|nr:coumaroyl-CoA:anthocyanidin 3-O-glucoside-6''-O-coumaroyltransferase 2-like [Oryza brachyantha]
MATKVLDKLTVAASPPAAGGVLPLTFFDVPWLFTGPVERVFFYPYPHPVDHFTAHLQPSLVSSLSAALHGFYPLLGRVRPCPPDGGGGYEFWSTGGDEDRVELTVAESSYDFDELSGGGPRDVGRLYSLVPQLPRPEDASFALAAVQVTIFPSRGIAVGVSIHHVACDDSSFMHFVKTWAGHCRVAAGADAATVPPAPFLDRGVVADPDGLAAKTLDQIRQLAAGGPPPPPPSGPPPKLVMASFTLTRDCIDKLKQRVTASGGGGGVHCSAFTVACAYAWTCLVRVDASAAGRERAHLLFSVECRRRLTPPVPQEYLGNCLRPCFVEVDMGGLLGADGVVTAAVGIGASIRGLDDGVLDGADGWFHKILSMMSHRPMSVGGSPRYGVYDTDFGLGRPRKVELLSIDKTPGTVSMAEGRDGQGGIEIGVALPEAEMDQFTSCFSDGLKQL